MFHKDFFRLQIEFAHELADKRNVPFKEILFQYTSLYVRSLGFSDTELPSQTNPEWQKILATLPNSKEEQGDYFHQKYLDYESSKPKTDNHPAFGCFSYVYHEKTNQYELHFDANDPEGNLAKERMVVRKAELQEMFAAIEKENHHDATFFVRTWMLNIKAFTRLFPDEFIATKKSWDVTTAQDNAHWGQFLDRFGNYRKELGDGLLENVKTENHEEVNLYFPLPALKAEIALGRLLNASI